MGTLARTIFGVTAIAAVGVGATTARPCRSAPAPGASPTAVANNPAVAPAATSAGTPEALRATPTGRRSLGLPATTRMAPAPSARHDFPTQAGPVRAASPARPPGRATPVAGGVVSA